MFVRNKMARRQLKGDALTSAMVGIGMLFAAKGNPRANIEDTLLAASEEGMDRDDYRVLGVLVEWWRVHREFVNADRLIYLVSHSESERVRAFWSALAQLLPKDRRFARLIRPAHPQVPLLRTGNEFQVRRRGEDTRFADTELKVPSGVLRHRPADVLGPAKLAQKHAGYRWRVIMGPSYRADMWASLEAEPALTPTELARKAYGSFATAWQVKRDRALVALTP